jgi:hypothetical protein
VARAGSPARHNGAVEADLFDDMTWRDVMGQAAAVRELIEDRGERHDYAADLVRDMFLAADKTSPAVSLTADMDPSRLVNRQVIAGLLESPGSAELRRGTVGDPHAIAMAVLAQAEAMRRMLEQVRDAQQVADQAARAAQEGAGHGGGRRRHQVAGGCGARGRTAECQARRPEPSRQR